MLPSKEEGRGVPVDEIPGGVFEDILRPWKGNGDARVGSRGRRAVERW